MEFGATAVVAERGEEGIAKVREILGGGADAALECVGTAAAVDQALGVLHNGGRLGFVGVPHYNNRALGSTFAQNISVAGGAASVTTYDKQFLLKAVLDGDINPFTPLTSLMIRLITVWRTSKGISAASAVMKSTVLTARRATA